LVSWLGAMPIDYSKFDNIDDSDEEAAAPKKTSPSLDQILAGAAPSGPSKGSGGYPSAPSKAPSKGGVLGLAPPPAPRKGRDGRELLEATNVVERFQLVPRAEGDGAIEGIEEVDLLSGDLGKLVLGQKPGDDPKSDPKAGEPKRLCMRSEGRKKIHTTFPDGAEMVEEFDERTDVLMLRKTRKPTTMGGEGEWVFEVGQAPEVAFDPYSHNLRASTSNPVFLRKDTPEHFQWRIRNLTWPADVYSITVDHEKQEIVVRTTNKKYFKRIGVPDCARLGLALKDEMLSWKHQHNTLIISYSKPSEVVADEQKLIREAEQTALKY